MVLGALHNLAHTDSSRLEVRAFLRDVIWAKTLTKYVHLLDEVRIGSQETTLRTQRHLRGSKVGKELGFI